MASDDTPRLRRLESILGMCGKGGDYLDRLHGDMHQNFVDLEDFVNGENKDASLTITVTLKVSLDRTGLMKLNASHKIKKPEPPASGGIAWMDNGNVTPSNPAQGRFDLREAPRATRTVIEDYTETRRFAEED